MRKFTNRYAKHFDIFTKNKGKCLIGCSGIIEREASDRIVEKLNSEDPIHGRVLTIADDLLDFTKVFFWLFA